MEERIIIRDPETLEDVTHEFTEEELEMVRLVRNMPDSYFKSEEHLFMELEEIKNGVLLREK